MRGVVIMTAAAVPQGATLILQESYDSREGICGTIRIRSEAIQRLRAHGLMPEQATYKTSSKIDGVTGLVRISIPNTKRAYLCMASIQPLAECELLIYVQPDKQRPSA